MPMYGWPSPLSSSPATSTMSCADSLYRSNTTETFTTPATMPRAGRRRCQEEALAAVLVDLLVGEELPAGLDGDPVGPQPVGREVAPGVAHARRGALRASPADCSSSSAAPIVVDQQRREPAGARLGPIRVVGGQLVDAGASRSVRRGHRRDAPERRTPVPSAAASSAGRCGRARPGERRHGGSPAARRGRRCSRCPPRSDGTGRRAAAG